MNNSKQCKKIALIIAGGIGARMKMNTPKQFIMLENKPIIIYTLEAFQNNSNIDEIIVVCLKGWEDFLKKYAKEYNITKLRWIVEGGANGQESIYNGICELEKKCDSDDIVIIHDANRPLVSNEIISDALSTFYEYGSAITAIPCVEVTFKSNDGKTADEHIPREQLRRTQTPQIYRLEKLLWAHQQAKEKNITNSTATCALMEVLGEKIYFSQGSEKNLKITTRDDLDIFKAILATSKENM